MKTYEKPQIYFESFEVSQYVAACGWDMSNHKSVETCTAEGDPDYNNISGVPAFIEANTNCLIHPEIYCETNGAENVEIRVFNS